MIRKISYIVPALVAMWFAAACSGGGRDSSPGEAARQYAEYIANGEYDLFVDGMYIPPETPQEQAEQARSFVRAIVSGMGAEMLEEKGGLKSVAAVSEEISEDGLSADVTLRYTYGNGETTDEDMQMRLDDAGAGSGSGSGSDPVWKIVL